MRIPNGRAIQFVAGALALTTVLSACAHVVDGTASRGIAPNASLSVIGDSNGAFDTTVKNALSDVTDFWRMSYPQIAAGKALPALKGGLYSVDGGDVVGSGKVSGPAAKEGCVTEKPKFIVDNAAYCTTDDSIIWDRNPDHLVAVLTQKYGPLMAALAFAHEYGHAIQQRLGIFDDDPKVIDTESQADCAAGAFLATIVAGKAAHFRATADEIDSALNGYLQVRDQTPDVSADISHGNGFDRLSALDDGLLHGPTFCYSSTYFDNLKFTERPFTTRSDYANGGDETLAQVLNANDPIKDATAGGLQPDLNRFWTAAAKSISKTWQDVKIAQADHPKCGASASSEFGYCPDDNTVYYSQAFATRAYNSLTKLAVNSRTAAVTLKDDQPADFALGTLFAMGWGMAVRHQLFNRATDGTDALLAAVCYVGAYAKDINLDATAGGPQQFLLSPPDMDEATSSMLNVVGDDKAFGARGTSGLQRVQSFVKGYQGGLSVC